MNSDGSNVRQLTHNTRHYDWLPAWSPDATRIAFASNRDGDFEIFTMNADGTNQHQLTHKHILLIQRRIGLPDGTRIAFTRYRDGDAEVFVMNADGTNQHQLTYNSQDDGLPSWSPDGAQIAFQSNRDGDEEIFVMNPDGTNHAPTHPSTTETTLRSELVARRRPDRFHQRPGDRRRGVPDELERQQPAETYVQ